jgi:coproporphyrinogen III oxidase
MTPNFNTEWLELLQDTICAGLEAVDGEAQFHEDVWERDAGGGGRTRILTGGAIFERAGVNWSKVHGDLGEAFSRELPGEGRSFMASGVSLVLHPKSPMIPTVHANVRMIQKGDASWCGGGMDLTPYYLVEEDAAHFHHVLRTTCDGFDPDWHPRFKQWCDQYFYLPHRGEARGIGGLFFDWLGVDVSTCAASLRERNPLAVQQPVPYDQALAFTQKVGAAFLDAYIPIVERRRDDPWGDEERRFQLIRRGRYVEFNLLYDRGTQFGLRTGGRAESILMSLPPEVRWVYDEESGMGTREAALLDVIRNPKEW